MDPPKPNKPPKRLRVPRASLAVTLLRDPDFVGLRKTEHGHRAWSTFTCLLLLAREQENAGIFTEDLETVATMACVSADDLEHAQRVIEAVCRRNGTQPWLMWHGETLIIRNFTKWNQGHGGRRAGSGRRGKSRGNQVAFKSKSSGDQRSPLVRVPVSVSLDRDTEQGTPPLLFEGPGGVPASAQSRAEARWPDALSDEDRRRKLREWQMQGVAKPGASVKASTAQPQAQGSKVPERRIEDLTTKRAQALEQLGSLQHNGHQPPL